MRFRASLGILASGALFVSACSRHEAQPPLIRPVRTIVIHYGAGGDQVSLTGQIQAQNLANLAFRIGGRLIERRVDVGDTVSRGQLIARIESQDPQNALRSAQADLSAAQAALVQARNNEERYRTLVTTGVVSRAQYDDAEQQLAAAQSRVASSQASVQTARDNVGYTNLYSDAAGVVTSKGAEPGEVVQAGQMIVQVAQKGGKDGVFNVPAALLKDPSRRNVDIKITLVDDPSIVATGHIREVAPQADPTTGMYVVKIGLDNPPDRMRLGATVTGSATLVSGSVVSIPGTALIQVEGKPAVWVVDPATQQVAARPVGIERYDTAAAIISSGLKDGDVVVTAGTHALRPGQQVRLLQPAG